MKNFFFGFVIFAAPLFIFSCSQNKESCPVSLAPKDVAISTGDGFISVEAKSPGNRISLRLNGKTYSSSSKKITVKNLMNNISYSFTVGMGFVCNSDTVWSEEFYSAIPSVLDKKAMLDEVNKWRANGCRCGNTNMPAVAPLVWDSQLELASAIHSIDMAKTKLMSHTGSDNSSPATRVSRVGYLWRTVGENVAYNYDIDKVIPMGWIPSEPHCKNIMSADYKDFAMSVAYSSDNQPFYTQVFGTRR